MADFKVGDEVRVLRHVRYRGDDTPQDTPQDGQPAAVTKVGRKYATASWTEVRPNFSGTGTYTNECAVEFEMATGTERDSRFGYYVRTPEQLALDQRRSDALAAIKAAGIEFRTGYSERTRTLEQIEALAEVVKTWKD